MKRRFIIRKAFRVKFKILIIPLILLSLTIIYKSTKYLINNTDIESFIINQVYDIDSKDYFNIEYFLSKIYGVDIDLVSTTTVATIVDVNTELDNLVYLYNTFQTTKYKSDYRNSYNINNVITVVNYILKEELENLGIGTIVEEESVAKVLKDNDYAYTSSYKGSRILMENANNANPTLNYFFDIQMSDLDYDQTNTTIDGVDYALILIVVGSDNKSYESNLELANTINELLEEYNISRGVSIRGGTGYQGVYNQDFNSNTLLLQIGGYESSMASVNRSTKILAKALATIIKEGSYE